MKAPYRQSASLVAVHRAHGCMLFSLLYLQRFASEGDVAPSSQGAIDKWVSDLRGKAGMTLAEYVDRGTTMTEAQRAYEASPFPDRLPPRMRLMRGGSVRDDLLPELRAGNLAVVAVNYGVIQDAGRGVGSFRGGHAVVVGEPENGKVAVADPLRSVVVHWTIDLLERGMETFGSRPWGNGRGEAGVAYRTQTYREALDDAREALNRTKVLLSGATDSLREAEGVVTLARRERDAALAELEECRTQAPPDCSVVEGERDAALARIEAARAALEGTA